MTKIEATTKAQRLRLSYKDDELANKIGISKPTLYTRLAKHNWKKSELHLINSLQ